jgi:hypothetical protein
MTAKLRLRSSWPKLLECFEEARKSTIAGNGCVTGTTFHGGEIVNPENEIGWEDGGQPLDWDDNATTLRQRF